MPSSKSRRHLRNLKFGRPVDDAAEQSVVPEPTKKRRSKEERNELVQAAINFSFNLDLHLPMDEGIVDILQSFGLEETLSVLSELEPDRDFRTIIRRDYPIIAESLDELVVQVDSNIVPVTKSESPIHFLHNTTIYLEAGGSLGEDPFGFTIDVKNSWKEKEAPDKQTTHSKKETTEEVKSISNQSREHNHLPFPQHVHEVKRTRVCNYLDHRRQFYENRMPDWCSYPAIIQALSHWKTRRKVGYCNEYIIHINSIQCSIHICGDNPLFCEQTPLDGFKVAWNNFIDSLKFNELIVISNFSVPLDLYKLEEYSSIMNYLLDTGRNKLERILQYWIHQPLSYQNESGLLRLCTPAAKVAYLQRFYGDSLDFCNLNRLL